MNVKEEDIPRIMAALVKVSGTREMSISSKVPQSGGRRVWHVPNVKYVNGRIQTSYNTVTGSTLVNALQKMMDELERSFDQPLAAAKKSLADLEKLQTDTMALFDGPVKDVTEDEVAESENELDTLDKVIQSIEI